MKLIRSNELNQQPELMSVNLRDFHDERKGILPLSENDVRRLWTREATEVNNPLYPGLANLALRFNYSRDGQEYLTGKINQLRLPDFNGKDIYALADEMILDSGTGVTIRLCDFGGGTGEGVKDIADKISARFGVKTEATVVDLVDFSLIPDNHPQRPYVNTECTRVNASLHEVSGNISEKEFDFILSMHTMKHTPDALSPLREGCQMLRQGGYLLFSAIPKDYRVLSEKRIAKTFMDVVDKSGKFVTTDELINHFNQWNSGSFIFEHQMLQPDSRWENITFAGDMISVKRIGSNQPDFNGVFFRAGIQIPIPNRERIGFILAKTEGERDDLLKEGFTPLFH